MKRKNLLLFLVVIVVFLAFTIITFPLSEDILLEKPVSEWINGEETRQSTLVIDGRITKRIISNQVDFEGDIYIKGVHNENLTHVKMQIKLLKKGLLNHFLVRPGLSNESNEYLAINESIGIAAIEGIFDEIIIFPRDEKSGSEIEVSDKKFWAENYEDGIKIISELKKTESFVIH